MFLEGGFLQSQFLVKFINKQIIFLEMQNNPSLDKKLSF